MPKRVQVIDEEAYLSINGACRNDIGDSALHKNKGNNSDKQWSKLVNYQAEKDRELISRREKLRLEYKEKVSKGEIRPPSRVERLLSIAAGHEDNASVQAARRLLEKQGISWQRKIKS
jgi:hypothetical protein